MYIPTKAIYEQYSLGPLLSHVVLKSIFTCSTSCFLSGYSDTL